MTLLIFLLGTYLDKKMSRKRKLFPYVLWWPFYVTGRMTSPFLSCLLCSLFCSENARRAAYCPCIWRSFTNLYLWLLFLQDCCGQRTRPRSALCYYKTSLIILFIIGSCTWFLRVQQKCASGTTEKTALESKKLSLFFNKGIADNIIYFIFLPLFSERTTSLSWSRTLVSNCDLSPPLLFVQWACSSLRCGTRLLWMISPPSRGNGLRWRLWQKSSCTRKSRRSSCPGCPAAQPPMQVGTVPLAAVSEDGARQLHY